MMQISTYFALMAEFKTSQIELKTISEKYFGLSPLEAAKRASVNRLPLPAFKCGTQKSKWMVHVQDLADLIETQRNCAEAEWQKMNS